MSTSWRRCAMAIEEKRIIDGGIDISVNYPVNSRIIN